MAGDDQADGIGGVGTADGARGARVAERGGELAVAARFSVGNGDQRRPHAFLKLRALGRERQGELTEFPGEVGVHLLFDRGDQRTRVTYWVTFFREALAEPGEVAEGGGDDGAGVVDGDGEGAAGRGESGGVEGHAGAGWLNCQRCAVARLR